MSKRLKVFGFLALVGAAIALETFQRGNLADPIPFPLTLLGAIFGALVGYVAAAAALRAKTTEKRYRKIIVLLTLPLFGLFAGTLLMRSLVLQAAFVGVQTKPQITSLQVVRHNGNASRRSRIGDTATLSPCQTGSAAFACWWTEHFMRKSDLGSLL